MLDAFFRQFKPFIRFRLVFVFRLYVYYLTGFSKIYQSTGLEPKHKGKTKSYECWDLTKNYI